MPPTEPATELIIPPLPYEGWTHYLTDPGWFEFYGVFGTPELVLLFLDEELHAFATTDGRRLWRHKLNSEPGNDWYEDAFLADNSNVYVTSGYNTLAIDRATGELRWTSSTWTPVGLAPDGVWATHVTKLPSSTEENPTHDPYEPVDDYYHVFYERSDDIALLSMDTGRELQVYRVGRVISSRDFQAQSTAYLPVKVEAGYRVLGTDGTVREVASEHPAWKAELNMVGDHFVSLEYPSNAQDPQEVTRLLTDFTLPEGQVAATHVLAAGQWSQVAGDYLVIVDGAVGAAAKSVLVTRVSDGKTVYDEQFAKSGPIAASVTGDHLQLLFSLTSEDSIRTAYRASLVDLRNGTAETVRPELVTNRVVSSYEVSPGCLFTFHVYTPRMDVGPDYDPYLQLIKLDDSGLLAEGRSALINAPTQGVIDPWQLFQQSTDPLKDPELMRLLVAGGDQAWSDVIYEVDYSDPEHANACAALAAYIINKTGRRELTRAFKFKEFAEVDKGYYRDLAQRWLADDTLKPLHAAVQQQLDLVNSD